MPKNIHPLLPVFLIPLFYFLFSIFYSPVLAQTTPTPTAIPTCDLCGWCNREINPKPQNWDTCMQCLYKPDGSPRERSYYTVIGCLSTDPTATPFTKSLLSIVFGIAGGISFLAVLYGSGLVLTSSGDPQQLAHGKEVIFSSILGIFLIVFSVFLLKVVGVDILGIPGFG